MRTTLLLPRCSVQNAVQLLDVRTGRPVVANVKFGSYKVKGQIGCQNNHIDEGTLEKAVMMAVKLLSENMDLLHGKWNKILEENQLLEKHYSVLLAELINKECWEYDSFDMCQVLDSILISEDGQITVRFLEGTEVDL